MWLPYNGKPNQIKVERELHHKYIVTELEGENETVAYNSSIIGNYSVDSFVGNFNAHTSPYLENSVLSQIENFSQTDSSKCVNFLDKPVNTSLFWKSYFDGSKSKEGAGAGCVLISPEGNKTMLTCTLKFDCTNNTAEYEALVQGLYKEIGLNVKYLQVFRDSKIVVKQEYDLEIKPTNIVRGQGFCKMLAGASQISEISSEEVQMCEVSLNDVESLYADIIYYLKNGYAPSHLDHTKKRALRLKAKQYQLINDILFRKNYDSVLLRCLEKTEAEKVLHELHDGPAGGHYAGDSTAHKILRAGYY
eukprot:PITA_08539